ncbi:hypothetical protein [Halorhodospira halophila]|uniref:hypothetical protein n=1 Tax=Halorhodospira halophila TaxID=1053 RepID=UPI0019148531|nr:hypothetical protein [Halorhodospira halophila]MBK5935482.1 hypothetical protein [Halorhodospira halophila]
MTLELLCARLTHSIERLSAGLSTQVQTPRTLRAACTRLAPCLGTVYRLQQLIDSSPGFRALDPRGGAAADLLKTQALLAGHDAVLASYVDALSESVGISSCVRAEALEALAEARRLSQRLETGLEGTRLLLLEHDTSCPDGAIPAQVVSATQHALERLRS